MANLEHFNLLRRGVQAWNEWREKEPDVEPDLSSAKLSDIYLRGAYLAGVNLNRANLKRTNLIQANLKRARLIGAKLNSADLTEAKLSDAILTAANLSEADLSRATISRTISTYTRFTGANLIGADLSDSNLTDADLSNTNLLYVDFRSAIFNRTNLTKASIGWVVFGNNDLSSVTGLERVIHRGPSTIGIDTIYQSKGEISELFLRRAGVPDNFITYMGSLTGKAFEFYSCFISYSSKNHPFAERIYADLQNKGVRCWFAPEDLKIGDRIRVGIDESIKKHDKLLLVLSEDSVASDWVEQEVETALLKERKEGRLVLFPIRLDDKIMEISAGWPALIRNTRNIGDFRQWKEHDSYQKSLDRLLRNLKTEDIP